MNGGKGRGGPVPLSTSINLRPGQGPFHPLSLPVFYWALPKRVGDDGPAIQNATWERSNVGCVGWREEEGEEQEVSGSGQEWVHEWRRE